MHIKPNFKVLVQNVYQNYDLGPLREVEGDGADSWESISHRINCRKVSASSQMHYLRRLESKQSLQSEQVVT